MNKNCDQRFTKQFNYTQRVRQAKL